MYSGAAGALFISNGVVSEGPGNALPWHSAKGTVINQRDTAPEPSTSLGPETPWDAEVTLPWPCINKARDGDLKEGIFLADAMVGQTESDAAFIIEEDAFVYHRSRPPLLPFKHWCEGSGVKWIYYAA